MEKINVTRVGLIDYITNYFGYTNRLELISSEGELNPTMMYDLVSICGEVKTPIIMERALAQLNGKGAIVVDMNDQLLLYQIRKDLDHRLVLLNDWKCKVAIFFKLPNTSTHTIGQVAKLDQLARWLQLVKFVVDTMDMKPIEHRDLFDVYRWMNKNHIMRFELLNRLIKEKGYQRYLEIGCDHDYCFNQVHIPVKIGVDPVSGGTFRGTSDEFFKQNSEQFDLVFIDGLHEREQVIRDVENSLKVLSPGGRIVLHDCLPPTPEIASWPRASGIWCGTVYQAFARLRLRKDLDCRVLDSDCGIGAIKVASNTDTMIGERRCLPSDPLEFEHYIADRDRIMGVIPTREFNEWLMS